MIDPVEVAARLEQMQATLGGRAAEITVVAVTKAFEFDAIAAAETAGIVVVGESYAQECIAKLEGRTIGPAVHFIGRLQRNKVRRLAALVDVWQSVDRPELVDEIAKRAPGASVMIQVDISNEPQKGGCPPADLSRLLDRARESGLVVAGLMGIGPIGEPELARPGFARLRRLVDDHGLESCSMGMSADLSVAVEEGTTMVRVGTTLFGPRPPRG